MSRVRLLAAAAAALAFALAGCSGGSGSGGDSGGVEVTARPTPTNARPSGTTVYIHIKGSTISTSGERIRVQVKDPVTLMIASDRAGELHVHSTPEQHISFPKGTSAARITVKQPGVVDIEDHKLDKLILQLEVR